MLAPARSLSPVEIVLVQDSFRKIARIAPQAAALFYARLFELDPATRDLFPGDMHEQGSVLMAAIANAINSLDRPDHLAAALRAQTTPHTEHPFGPVHGGAAGTALIWTLEKGLGGEFTPPLREAWQRVCAALADTLAGLPGQTCPA